MNALLGARPAPPRSARDRGVERVLFVALGLNLLVAAAKILIGRSGGLLAIEADGYHSLSDGFGSVVALVGLALARRPPDPTHPYGHRKYEVVAGLLIGLSLLLVAAEVVSEAVTRLEAGTATEAVASPLAIVVLVVTLGINYGISSFQARRARTLGSALLASDARHTRADCWVTLGVLATTALTHLGQRGLDVAAAVVVAVLIAKAGLEVIKENAGYLTDVALVPPTDVEAVAMAIAPVLSVERVRTRGTPSAVFMDLRLRLPDHLSMREVSEVVRRASAAIRSEFPEVVDVVVHPECG